MKSAILIVVGAILTIFIYLIYQNVNSKSGYSDNEKANEIFSKYLQSGADKVANLELEEQAYKSLLERLNKAKQVLNSTQFSNIEINETNGITDEVNERLLAVSQSREIIYSNELKIPDAITQVQNALENAYYYSFSELWDYLKDPSSRNEESVKKIINDKNRFEKSKESLLTTINQYAQNVETSISNFSKEKAKVVEDETATKKAKEHLTQNSKDKLLITMVIPIFAVILAIIILIPYLFREKEAMFSKLLDDKILIQVFTIFILVITILLLGIGGKLNPETLGTLLGGISVYVLQKSLDN